MDAIDCTTYILNIMLLVFILVMVVGVVAPHSAREAYEVKYRAVVTPLSLYLPRPPVLAPISPTRTRSQASGMRTYLHALFNHEAYIHPDGDNRLAALRIRTITTLTHESETRARDYQSKSSPSPYLFGDGS